MTGFNAIKNAMKNASVITRRHCSARLVLQIPVLLALILGACSAVQPAQHVRIAAGVVIPLLLPEQSASLSQKITATYRQETHVLIMQVQASPQQVIIAGLAPTGTRLFSLTFDGKTLESWQSPLFHAPFDGAYVLADYQLAALGLAQLQQTLPGNVTLEESGSGNTRTRVLRNADGNPVIRIEYAPDNTRYCHLERDYCLHIENL